MTALNDNHTSQPHMLRGSLEPKAKIIAIGGGKGGAGKSFVSSNVALFLANIGYKTILVDLDLGCANAHTTLGEGQPKTGIGDFIRGSVKDLEQIAAATNQPNLRLISGCSDDLEIANLNIDDRSLLMSSIFNLNADYIVLDLSAGTNSSTLDFFLMAQYHIVVFTPEPTSIENAYRFMKASFFRKIKRFERQFGLENILAEIMAEKDKFHIKYPADLVTAVSKVSPHKAADLIQELNKLHFHIILNQTRSFKDIEIGKSVQSVANKFFGIPTDFIGHLEYDNAVWQSLRKRKPLLVEYPHSRLYAQILNITKSITYADRYKAVV